MRDFQPVCQVDFIARPELREIDDNVAAVGDPKIDIIPDERARQEIAVIGNDDERQRVLALLRQVKLIQPRWPAIQETKAVFAPLDFEMGLDRPVYGEAVSQHSVNCVHRIVGEAAEFIRRDHRDAPR